MNQAASLLFHPDYISAADEALVRPLTRILAGGLSAAAVANWVQKVLTQHSKDMLLRHAQHSCQYMAHGDNGRCKLCLCC